MQVKLVSITKSVVDDKELSAEELLSYIARVSNPSNQLNTETADKLLGYMIKHKHWSPFDMVNMTVEVTTSKAVGIQILRHWSIKPQEFSQRYAEVVDIEPVNFRLQADKNRQSSSTNIGTVLKSEPKYGNGFYIEMDQVYLDTKYVEWFIKVADLLEVTLDVYQEGLKLGVAKECARMILPMATSTTMYLNGSVRSWIHYMEQRTDLHAQLEHRLVAEEIKKIFIEQFPMISKALNLI